MITNELEYTTVMVNFMCQLDWVKKHPDMWPEHYSGYISEDVPG